MRVGHPMLAGGGSSPLLRAVLELLNCSCLVLHHCCSGADEEFSHVGRANGSWNGSVPRTVPRNGVKRAKRAYDAVTNSYMCWSAGVPPGGFEHAYPPP